MRAVIFTENRIYGGQAVIEGVMMRNARAMAVAVRNPDGKIELFKQTLTGPLRGRIAQTPFVRGVVGLVDAFGLGVRSLMYSASVASGEEAEYEGPLAWGTMAFSLTFGIGLFFLLPAALGQAGEEWLGLSVGGGNLLEGVVRMGLVVGYIWAIGFVPDIGRIYGYHGAEHKTVHAFEADAELTPEAVARFPREHPRCGTAFLLVVVVFSVLIFAAFGPLPLLWRLGTRLLLLPVLASVAYEYLRLTARNMHLGFVRLIVRPTLVLQRLTTREPDEAMLAVAIAAFRAMQAVEEGDVPA
ncbi:MAG TPA: DUF1385 domain-containing protein [Anaerolineales bacterium]|nr:DUF1385 domain-containing protein [Anaerolineales bacterium]